jgi:hypothetical protein
MSFFFVQDLILPFVSYRDDVSVAVRLRPGMTVADKTRYQAFLLFLASSQSPFLAV